MKSEYKLREMNKEDLLVVFNWRNHPNIRKFMVNTEVVNFSEHEKWFLEKTTDPLTRILIFENNTTKTGFVNFKISEDQTSAIWGFYKSPNAPSGFGTVLCGAALQYAFNNINLAEVIGLVRLDNPVSMRLHEKLGFEQKTLDLGNNNSKKYPTDMIRFQLCKENWTNQHN